MSSLSTQQREALRAVLAERKEVARAFVVAGGERPTLVFEYDERPPTVEAAQTAIQELLTAVSPVLGEAAHELGFSAGGPEEVAGIATVGDVIYVRT